MANLPSPRVPKSITAVTDQLVLPEVREIFPLLNSENLGRPISLFSGLFLHATLPHSPPPTHSYVRHTQRFSLELLASPSTGLPFGRYPRLFLAWLTTVTAQRRPSREVGFDASLGAFLATLGIPDGTRTRRIFQHQLEALLNTRYALFYRGAVTNKDGTFDTTGGAAFLLATEWSLWTNRTARADSHLRVLLTEEFHAHLLERRIPLDWTVLQSLQAPMAMDIYAALVEWSAPERKHDLAIPWSDDPNGLDLMTRFGADYTEPREFRRKFRKHLATVLRYYPEARVVADDPHHLIIRPYPPHLKYLNSRRSLTA